MNLILCPALKNLWYEFYNNYIRNVDTKVRYSIGITMFVISLLVFIGCTKGKNSSNLINNWFLFWISSILMVISIIYLTI